MLDLTTPNTGQYLYAGLAVDPPHHAPVVRGSTRRDTVLGDCGTLVHELVRLPGVRSATVFRTTVMPPLPHVPRCDVLLLVHGEGDALDEVQQREDWTSLQPRVLLRGRNVRRIGSTALRPDADQLFNHFTAPDEASAIAGWEQVAPWYQRVLGVDNSLLLAPDPQPASDQETALRIVNHVRTPSSPARFLLGQLARPSFHREVRPALARHGMAAFPLLCRPVDSAGEVV